MKDTIQKPMSPVFPDEHLEKIETNTLDNTSSTSSSNDTSRHASLLRSVPQAYSDIYHSTIGPFRDSVFSSSVQEHWREAQNQFLQEYPSIEEKLQHGVTTVLTMPCGTPSASLFPIFLRKTPTGHRNSTSGQWTGMLKLSAFIWTGNSSMTSPPSTPSMVPSVTTPILSTNPNTSFSTLLLVESTEANLNPMPSRCATKSTMSASIRRNRFCPSLAAPSFFALHTKKSLNGVVTI